MIKFDQLLEIHLVVADHGGSNPKISLNPLIGKATGGVYKDQGRYPGELLTRAY